MQTPDSPTDFHIVKIARQLIYIPHNDVIFSLQQLLRKNSQEKNPHQYGLKSAQIQTLFDSFYQSTLQSYSPSFQIYFGYRFLSLHTPEEKRVGILTLSKNINFLTKSHLEDIERILDNDINDWVMCDALSNKVVAQLLKSKDDCVDQVYNWKECGKIWRMRACCIVFVNFANTEEDKCMDICHTCVKSSERFVQLGVGCLLREMSMNYTTNVVSFIYDNYRYFTREGLRYSIDKLDVSTRKDILNVGKGRNNPSKSPQPPSQAPSPNPQIQTVDNQIQNQIMSLDNLQSGQPYKANGFFQINQPSGQIEYVQTSDQINPPNYYQYYSLQNYNVNGYTQQ
ncbi:Uncharacterized protein QTN25_008082 [Entamoeba marina]